jgi:DUF917 family protein
VCSLKTLTHQDLADLVDGAAIFSAGGGGDPQVGHNIVERLVNDHCRVCLIDPNEVPDNEIVMNFACVGATSNVAYHSDAAVRTLKALEDFVGKQAYAVIPVELGGFNTLAAVDVAARRGIPVVDADGAGRAVPEVHLKLYTLDNISIAPMAMADLDGENVVLVEHAKDSKSAERIARSLSAEWNQMAYTARRILSGRQTKTSPLAHTLSRSIRIGMLLRKAIDPLSALLKETEGFQLFEGIVKDAERQTKEGFTWTTLRLTRINGKKESKLELKAKNEFLAAHKNGKVVAIAPDIITVINRETCKCVPAEKIKRGDRITVLGIPAPEKWRSPMGLELWREVLQRSGIDQKYMPIEKLVKKA